MSQNAHQDLNDLIRYYQGLNNYNQKFPNFSSLNYEPLVEELISIRQLLINKSTTNINSIYKPIENLFASYDHFKVLEKTIQFYKQNEDAIYPAPESEEYAENNNINSTNELSSDIVNELPQSIERMLTDTKIAVTKLFENLDLRLYDVEERLKTQYEQWTKSHEDKTDKTINMEALNGVRRINDTIDDILDNNLLQSVTKSSQDILTRIKTNHEFVKVDLAKYDELLTNHITKTSANITEAIEKEYTRFVHRLSSDINAIVAGIIQANITELATQTKLVQANLDKFDNKIDNKFLKWFSGIFFMCAFMLFGNSILSSSWAAKKTASYAKLVKLSMTCNNKPTKAVGTHKLQVKSNDDDE